MIEAAVVVVVVAAVAVADMMMMLMMMIAIDKFVRVGDIALSRKNQSRPTRTSTFLAKCCNPPPPPPLEDCYCCWYLYHHYNDAYCYRSRRHPTGHSKTRPSCKRRRRRRHLLVDEQYYPQHSAAAALVVAKRAKLQDASSGMGCNVVVDATAAATVAAACKGDIAVSVSDRPITMIAMTLTVLLPLAQLLWLDDDKTMLLVEKHRVILRCPQTTTKKEEECYYYYYPCCRHSLLLSTATAAMTYSYLSSSYYRHHHQQQHEWDFDGRARVEPVIIITYCSGLWILNHQNHYCPHANRMMRLVGTSIPMATKKKRKTMML